MANTQQKKPAVYGGAYDEKINQLADQYANRTPFQYDVNGDALYQQYKDQYTRNAQRSMKDTMGQAASLTGGYGNTYAQNVGQQAYDRNMQALNDKIPELEARAYDRWKSQGEDILNQYNLMNQLGAADQATRQYQQEWDFQQQQYADQRSDAQRDWDFKQQQYADTRSDINREWDFQQQQYGDTRSDIEREWDFTQKQYADTLSQYGDKQAQLAYENLATAVLQSGYQPTKDELTAAGMTQQQADALRQAWIGANPGLAYMQGVLSAEDYFKLTGQQAPGAVVASSGGGGGGGGKKTSSDPLSAEKNAIQQLYKKSVSAPEVNQAIHNDPTLSVAQKRELYKYSQTQMPINSKPDPRFIQS